MTRSAKQFAAVEVDAPAAAPVWLWLNLLSADAPAVAIAWAALFARSRGLVLSAANLAALALIVWLIYLTDRLLDASAAPNQAMLRARHVFSGHHRVPLACIVAFGIAAATWLVREDLAAKEIRAGLALGAIVAVYMFAVHVPSGGPDRLLRQLLPKEIAVGLLFAAGTMLPVWCRSTFSALSLLRWTLFALLCSLNCVAIECWENKCWENQRANEFVDVPTRNLTSAAPHHTKHAGAFLSWCNARLSWLAALLVVLCCVASAAFRTPAVAMPATTIGAAALLTMLLNATRERFSAPALRVLADVALLLPALVALIHF